MLFVNVCNLRTGYISLQYHRVVDDLFETTILAGDNDPVINNICNNLFDSIRNWYAAELFDPVGQLIYRPPQLADFWLDEHGHREQK